MEFSEQKVIDRKAVLSLMIELAKERRRIHLNHEKSFVIEETPEEHIDREYTGIVGEWDFHRKTGLPIDLSRRLGGDGKVDFICPKIGFIDVKTYRKAKNMLRPVGVEHAAILVLAQFYEEIPCEFLGWEFDCVMLTCPTRRFVENGPLNHYKPAEELRDMDILFHRINKYGGLYKARYSDITYRIVNRKVCRYSYEYNSEA